MAFVQSPAIGGNLTKHALHRFAKHAYKLERNDGGEAFLSQVRQDPHIVSLREEIDLFHATKHYAFVDLPQQNSIIVATRGTFCGEDVPQDFQILAGYFQAVQDLAKNALHDYTSVSKIDGSGSVLTSNIADVIEREKRLRFEGKLITQLPPEHVPCRRLGIEREGILLGDVHRYIIEQRRHLGQQPSRCRWQPPELAYSATNGGQPAAGAAIGGQQKAIIATGHSLGGYLALSLGLRFHSPPVLVHVVAFNPWLLPSPMVGMSSGFEHNCCIIRAKNDPATTLSSTLLPTNLREEGNPCRDKNTVDSEGKKVMGGLNDEWRAKNYAYDSLLPAISSHSMLAFKLKEEEDEPVASLFSNEKRSVISPSWREAAQFLLECNNFAAQVELQKWFDLSQLSFARFMLLLQSLPPPQLPDLPIVNGLTQLPGLAHWGSLSSLSSLSPPVPQFSFAGKKTPKEKNHGAGEDSMAWVRKVGKDVSAWMKKSQPQREIPSTTGVGSDKKWGTSGK